MDKFKKNTLYVMSMDVEVNDLLRKYPNTNLEDIIVLENGPISSLFDDFMRSIIIGVYHYDIKEIVVVNPSQNKQSSLRYGMTEKMENHNKEKISTLNYLFKNCKPEFPVNDLSEWFTADMKNIVQMISEHPLIPSDIKVTEINY